MPLGTLLPLLIPSTRHPQGLFQPHEVVQGALLMLRWGRRGAKASYLELCSSCIGACSLHSMPP